MDKRQLFYGMATTCPTNRARAGGCLGVHSDRNQYPSLSLATLQVLEQIVVLTWSGMNFQYLEVIAFWCP